MKVIVKSYLTEKMHSHSKQYISKPEKYHLVLSENRKLLWASLKYQTQNDRSFYWSLPFLPRYKLDCPIKPSCLTRISRWTFSNFALPFPYKSVKITTPITTTDWSLGSCHSMCIGTEEGGGTVMYKRWPVALLEWSSALGRSIN